MLELLVDIRLKDKLRDCAYVNQFYIETRYPSDSYIPVSEKKQRIASTRQENYWSCWREFRLLFDYYREKAGKPYATRPPGFSHKSPQICAISTKPFWYNGLRLDGLITPTL